MYYYRYESYKEKISVIMQLNIIDKLFISENDDERSVGYGLLNKDNEQSQF
jgi:hypothetical protein